MGDFTDTRPKRFGKRRTSGVGTAAPGGRQCGVDPDPKQSTVLPRVTQEEADRHIPKVNKCVAYMFTHWEPKRVTLRNMRKALERFAMKRRIVIVFMISMAKEDVPVPLDAIKKIRVRTYPEDRPITEEEQAKRLGKTPDKRPAVVAA